MPTRTADAGLRISAIDLDTRAQVPGINEEDFLEQAELAKNNCIVSQALKGTEIRLQATLAETARQPDVIDLGPSGDSKTCRDGDLEKSSATVSWSELPAFVKRVFNEAF